MRFNIKHYLIKRFRNRTYILTVIVLLSALTFSQNEKIIKGVVSDGNIRLSNAIIKWQGAADSSIADQNGNFELTLSSKSKSSFITAWKKGFYNGGVSYKNNLKNIEIILTPLPSLDNKNYKFVDPLDNNSNDNQNCGDCHTSIIYKQWSHSAHSKSATNPIFFDLYNGTDATGKKIIPPGFKLDYEFSNGNCGNCHAPVSAINNFNNVDMNKLESVDKLGVSCDFCHKIKNIHLKSNSSAFNGVMQYEMLRPPEGHQIFFGPFTDMLKPNVFSESISQSLFCAPCHQGSSWGVPIYDSYDQWLKSPYAKAGINCQTCHMIPDGKTTNIAPGKGGRERDPNTIFSHQLLGSDDSTFIASAVQMNIKTKMKNDNISIIVEIENSGAGHHIPTDQPMRNMILVVRVLDENGNNLKYVGNEVIPFWGGRGKISDGNYEGLPGKGFAKILFEDWTQYERLKVGAKGQQIFPAPQWKTVQIKSDTRIPALQKDTSTYQFQLNKNVRNVTVECKLIYRRTFKTWANMKKWKLKDIVLKEKNVRISK